MSPMFTGSRDYVGYIIVLIDVTKDDIQHGFTITMDLYVKENGGRNSGKSAHFTVTYTFTVKQVLYKKGDSISEIDNTEGRFFCVENHTQAP